jgi:hypothetical protein
MMSVFLILASGLALQQPELGAEPDSDRELGRSAYVDLELGAGYSTNPLLADEGGNGQAFGRVSAQGGFVRTTTRSSTSVTGYAQSLFYTGQYSAQQSLALAARHSAAINERVQLFGDISGSFDKGGQLDTRIMDFPTLPGSPILVPDVPGTLPAGGDFLSVSGRRYRLGGRVGASIAVNPRDSLNITVGAERARFRSPGVETEYSTISSSAGYERQLTERAAVGAQLGVQRTDYDGLAKSTQFTPQLTARLRLSPGLTAAGAAGLSFTSTDTIAGDETSVGLALSGTVCSQGEVSSICGRVNVDQSATTVGGPAKTVGLGVDYARELGRDQTLRLSLAASRYSSPIPVFEDEFNTTNYYRAAADYSRRIGDRLHTGVSLAARILDAENRNSRPDISGSAFIRYRLGGSR